MEYNVIYQNSADFLTEDRSLIEETLRDVASVAFDAKSIQLKISKNKETTEIECQISVIKNTETITSDVKKTLALCDSLEDAKSNILDKVLEKNVFILSNAA